MKDWLIECVNVREKDHSLDFVATSWLSLQGSLINYIIFLSLCKSSRWLLPFDLDLFAHSALCWYFEDEYCLFPSYKGCVVSMIYETKDGKILLRHDLYGT